MVVATSVWTDVLFQKDTQGQKEKHLPIKASAIRVFGDGVKQQIHTKTKEKHLPIKASAARSHIANNYCSRQANEKANAYS